MAFCGKCGKPVDDGAAFCAACGNPMNSAPNQQADPRPVQPKAAGGSIVKLPTSLGGWIGIGAVVVSFILLFLSWSCVDMWFTKLYFGAFGGEALMGQSLFKVNALFGIGNIFAIITIVAFVVYIVAYFVNLKALVPGLANMDLEKLGKTAYFVGYALTLVFHLIGILIESSVAPTVGFFVSVVFLVIAILATKEGFLKKIIPSLK